MFTDATNDVPQASIFCPLLFSIYVNDFKYVSDKLKFVMNADDTAIYYNLEDFTPDVREAEINAELEKVNVGLKVNKLTLNTSKTKLMLIIY